MVRLQTLDLRIGVRVPASQPEESKGRCMMKMAKLGLFLMACSVAYSQETTVPSEKAPNEVNEALRSRVQQFYQAFVEGKFRTAYLFVAEDSQDAFMESGKDQYKKCETIKMDYTADFTKARVLESCDGVWKWHGQVINTKIPLTTFWKLANGQWDWYYVRPTEVRTPFGISKVPAEETNDGKAAPVIPDNRAMLQMVNNAVKVDKSEITLHGWEASKDELHVLNEMPGVISLILDFPGKPGLKVSCSKTELMRNEEAVVVFEYKPDDAAVLCGECAKRLTGSISGQLLIVPSGRTFPVSINFPIPPHKELPLPPEPKR
jgi:hypothetical protein